MLREKLVVGVCGSQPSIPPYEYHPRRLAQTFTPHPRLYGDQWRMLVRRAPVFEAAELSLFSQIFSCSASICLE